jgi:predicted deacylase
LHNGPVSTRHIYVPEYARESAKHFNIANVILIPNLFAGALDEATFCQWWHLQEYLLQMDPLRSWNFNVEAFTMEMGSQEVIDFGAGHYDALSILSYLNYKGCFEQADYRPDTLERVAVYLRDYKILYSQEGGIVEYIAKPDERISSGQIMAKVLNIDELDNPKATSSIIAPCDLIPILHFPSASILGGTQLYKCFTNYFLL